MSIPALPISRTPPIPLNASLTRLFDHRIEEEEKESPEKKGGLPSPPRRRVRIMELPYREFERKNSGRLVSYYLSGHTFKNFPSSFFTRKQKLSFVMHIPQQNSKIQKQKLSLFWSSRNCHRQEDLILCKDFVLVL